MNKTLIVVLGVLAVVVGLPLVIGTIMCVSTNNTCVTYEANLAAVKQQSKSQYDTFWKSVKEVAQVPSQYSKDMKETYAAIMDSRYKDKNPLMNWIKEANPNFDSSMYKQVQQVIESGRNDFKDSQKQMIDSAREYKTYVQKMPTSFIAHLMGHPGPDFKWSDYEPVTSDRSEDAFATRKDEAVDVFNKGAAK